MFIDPVMHYERGIMLPEALDDEDQLGENALRAASF